MRAWVYMKSKTVIEGESSYVTRRFRDALAHGAYGIEFDVSIGDDEDWKPGRKVIVPLDSIDYIEYEIGDE